MAADNGSVHIYRVFVVDARQRNDRAAADSGNHQTVRGDGTESRTDLDRYGGLLQHRRRHDANRRSAKCHHSIEFGC